MFWTTDSESSGSCAWSSAPPPRLRTVVERIWSVSDPARAGQVERHFASPVTRLVFHVGRGRILCRATPAGPARPRAFIIGPHDRPFAVRWPDDGVQIVGADLRLESTRRFLTLPPEQIKNRVLDMATLWGECALDTAAILAGVPAPRRVALLATLLMADRVPLTEIEMQTAEMVQALRDPGSAGPIRMVGEHLDISPRRLIRHLREETGLKPKLLHRLLRFERAVRLESRARLLDWGNDRAHGRLLRPGSPRPGVSNLRRGVALDLSQSSSDRAGVCAAPPALRKNDHCVRRLAPDSEPDWPPVRNPHGMGGRSDDEPWYGIEKHAARPTGASGCPVVGQFGRYTGGDA